MRMQTRRNARNDDPAAQAEALRQSLADAGGDEQQWREVDQVLRRLVGRLCIAARGQDGKLDGELSRITTAVRQPAAPPVLERLLSSLSEAIAGLDQRPVETRDAPAPLPALLPAPTSAPPSAAAPSSASAPSSAPASAQTAGHSLAEILGGLLERLSLSPPLRSEANQLRTQLGRGTASLVPALEQCAALVNRRIDGLQREKAQVEELLREVTGRLDEMDSHLLHESEQRAAARDSTRALDQHVLGEIRALGAQAQAAADLPTLQLQVRGRLQLIGGHLQRFREQQLARLAEGEERAQGLQKRIAELEHTTRSMRETLQRERTLALTDALTGIPNRLAYEERIGTDFARWQRSARPLAIAVWDVDHFKRINDGFGHEAGDRTLRVVARALAHGIRQTDFVARYGGEEFVMLIDGSSPQDSLLLADKLRGSIGRLEFHYQGRPVPVTISCGITALAAGDTPEKAFVRADAALYAAKQGGRNRCQLA